MTPFMAHGMDKQVPNMCTAGREQIIITCHPFLSAGKLSSGTFAGRQRSSTSHTCSCPAVMIDWQHGAGHFDPWESRCLSWDAATGLNRGPSVSLKVLVSSSNVMVYAGGITLVSTAATVAAT